MFDMDTTTQSQEPNDPQLNAEQIIESVSQVGTAPQPVASYMHTFLLIIVMLLMAYVSARGFATKQANGEGQDTAFHIGKYLPTLIWQWILFGVVYVGIKNQGMKLTDIIGGWWKDIEEFLLDIVIAFGFFVTALITLALLQKLLLPPEAMDASTRVKNMAPLAPHSYMDLGMFILVAITAGIVEETVFRGYFQKQFSAFTGSALIGIVLSAVLFGSGHVYQGKMMALVLAFYGLMFGVMAHFRKNLRPGMIAHIVQDSFSGTMLFFLSRHPDLLEKAKHM
jgi:membrane protease YdiL (CAAX protease family)